MKQSYDATDPAFREPAWTGYTPQNVNLVLEGGAMRGQFTAGVLDYFMDHGLWATNVLGTSAGALNGFNYAAGELGRVCFINTKYCNDPRYLSLKSFAHTGSVMGIDFMFDEIPNKLCPFNYHAFDTSPCTLYTVASNLETGEADYHKCLDSSECLPYLIASASMPLVSKIVDVDGKKLLDGGTCDSVPLLYSMMLGNTDKHIVVLTQDETFIKRPDKTLLLARRMYDEYPYYLDRMEHRYFEYNRTYRWVQRLHDAGKIFMIRPPEPVTISNLEHDPQTLFDLYEQGYETAARSWDDLQAYLAQP